jgi:serine/threonine protein kinase
MLGQSSSGITYLARADLQADPAATIETKENVVIREFFMKDFCLREESASQVTSADKQEIVEACRNRFIEEAMNLSRLRHPNIVKVIDVFEQNGAAYYVMEYIEGRSLRECVENKGILPEHEALNYIRQAAYALAYIHEHQITHLNIKPDNIICKPDNNIVLIDFGILKSFNIQAIDIDTSADLNNCAYVPFGQDKSDDPQQFSAVTDVYSLAATLYELLTAVTPPMPGKGLLSLPDHISKPVASAIEKSMQPAHKRPQSIRSFLQLLYSSDAAVAGEPEQEVSEVSEVSPQTLIRVESKGKYGYVDANGKKIIPLKYDKAEEFSDGLALVKLSNKYSYIDTSGRIVIALKYEFIGAFSDGLALVKLNGKFGYMDTRGKKIISPKYDKAGDFSEGFARVKLNNKYGYINTKGKKIIPLKYDRSGNFSEGLAWVRINSKYGYINTKGEEVIPLKYDRAGDFSKGIARVEIDCECGYINTKGEEIIPPKYDWVWDFTGGLAKAQLDGTYLWIDKQGNEYETEEEGREATGTKAAPGV